MPLHADFPADLEGDRIVVPGEIAERLRAAGALRLRVRLEPVSEDPALLAARGIDQEAIATVAGIQKIDREVASFVLAGEGIAAATSLGERLVALAASTTE